VSSIEPLESLAAADAHIGRAFPLPARPLPLARWVEVRRITDDGAEVAWNLDDSRPGTPGRVALFAGRSAPPDQLGDEGVSTVASNGMVVRRVPLEEAEPSLRPVVEIAWRRFGLHLRLTAQGPWDLADVVALADSVGG
jgi:hypothetical protein